MKNLLVLNYVMDTGDPLLSHQASVVDRLSPLYNHIYVLTGRFGEYTEQGNISVISSKWKQNRPIRNSLNLYFCFFRLVLNCRIDVIFSHMTDVQCALISPFSKILRIRHFLWYAHKYRSRYLNWSSIWVNGVITSTKGSCPSLKREIFTIGQGVDSELFMFTPNNRKKFCRIIHIGRFDQSKNIQALIDTVASCRTKHPELEFMQVGSPGNKIAEGYAKEVKFKSKLQMAEGWLTFSRSVNRSSVPSLLSNSDLFLHAYPGSLDKSLIEATLVGTPVVTINAEYKEIFGVWDRQGKSGLLEELEAFLSMDMSTIDQELIRRRRIAESEHSLNIWTQRLAARLNG